ncbi:MAG: hypothetical protein ACUZ8O_08030 [Candidatus Anammoxibacter sp.]
MFLKLKLIVLFVSVFSISCFTLNFISAPVNAQDATQAQSEKPQQSACPLSKSGKPSCDAAAAGCGSQGCCNKTRSCCSQNIGCAKAQGCNTPCGKKGGYGKGGGHSAADMMGLVHRAKRELLKEKIKAKIDAKMGKKLDKVADLLVEAVFEEYKAGRVTKERRAELEKKMIEIFSGKAGK